MLNTHLPPLWRFRLLGVIGASGRWEHRKLLGAWAQAEGGTARWNPLNTTLPMPGATNYNNAGVRDYPRPIVGLCATAATLANGFYDGILRDLTAGTFTARQIVERNRAEFDKWGTGAANVLKVLG